MYVVHKDIALVYMIYECELPIWAFCRLTIERHCRCWADFERLPTVLSRNGGCIVIFALADLLFLHSVCAERFAVLYGYMDVCV